jgi:hypothetical protein
MLENGIFYEVKVCVRVWYIQCAAKAPHAPSSQTHPCGAVFHHSPIFRPHMMNIFFFVYFFGGLCRTFCIFERHLASNPESCRSKQARYQLRHCAAEAIFCCVIVLSIRKKFLKNVLGHGCKNKERKVCRGFTTAQTTFS